MYNIIATNLIEEFYKILMDNIKISVVIPVYNVEKYLSECIDSLINQTLKEVEIICVDDGSTDNSPQILDEYAKKDTRIKVFHQENKGVSVARNDGIKKVQGEYLTFVDSDDWLELNALEVLYNTAKKRKSDVLLFSFYSYYPNKLEKNNRLVPLKNIIKDSNTTFLESYKYILDTPMGTWAKLYKTNLIQDNEIKFPPNIQCSEDRPFYIQSCINAKNISVLDEPFYYYRRDISQSLTQGNSNSVSDSYKANQIIKQMIYKLEDKKKIFCSFLKDYIQNILWAWDISKLKSNASENIKYLKLLKKECKEFKNYEDFPKENYIRLENKINYLNSLYIRKLIEPFFELEKRNERLAIYFLEKQIINIPKFLM